MAKKLKYVEVKEVFQEFPDEITLAFNISNCPCGCEGCHSSYLAEDKGTPLTLVNIMNEIEKHPGITCVGFMGGDANPAMINLLAQLVKEAEPRMKIGWYSGRTYVDTAINLHNFDYIKIGPYIKSLGPLSSEKTNQNMYEIRNGKYYANITHRFRKKELGVS